MSIFDVLLISFLIARICVMDVCHDVMSRMMTCKMWIFCIFEFHLIFDFILSEETDSFKPE